MHIEPFKVERWLDRYENCVEFNLTSTSLPPFTLRELIEVTGSDEQEVLAALLGKRLNYGAIRGSSAYREGVAALYETVSPEDVLSTHGGVGAVDLAIRALVDRGDHVVSVLPAYQQMYSIPESIGASVERVFLRREQGFALDMDELESRLTQRTKAVCLINPNNPTGQVLPNETLRRLAALADERGFYLICDESYRGLTNDCASVADICTNAVSLGSMSKSFALAGLRLGWLATRNAAAMEAVITHRDYCIISCASLDEHVASLALAKGNVDRVRARNIEMVRRGTEVLRRWLDGEPRVSCLPPAAGTIALVYPLVYPAVGVGGMEQVCEALVREKSVLLAPGECFEMQGCFRVGCGRETPQRVEAGLRRVSEFLRDRV
ncbi:MAG: aminotransferase class I/II-fold pyridoxal phosphate-dependent enzyme [Synergistaceae bacterium]|jgi:aspartate/methionine/tyrosine aminotransferase|nr:aminotransferase class I/II-fold pyridoxal phosphate-dependent enzyme [Synergistaceae bacterium]